MNIHQIKCFIKVAQLQNISKAAEELYLTQPAVTKVLKTIEKELNCELFNRTTHGLTLTKEGNIFLQHALEIENEYDRMLMDLDQTRKDKWSSLLIGYTTNYHRICLEKSFQYLLQKEPITLNTIQKMPYELIEMLKKGEITCALMHLPSIEGIKGINYATIQSGGAAARISKKDELATKEEVSIQELINYTLVINKHSCPKFRTYYTEPFISYGKMPEMKIVDNKANAEMLAGIGKHITVSSEHSIAGANDILIPIKELRKDCDIVLVWRQNDENIYIKELLQALLRDITK